MAVVLADVVDPFAGPPALGWFWWLVLAMAFGFVCWMLVFMTRRPINSERAYRVYLGATLLAGLLAVATFVKGVHDLDRVVRGFPAGWLGFVVAIACAVLWLRGRQQPSRRRWP